MSWRPSITCIPKASSTETSNLRTCWWTVKVSSNWSVYEQDFIIRFLEFAYYLLAGIWTTTKWCERNKTVVLSIWFFKTGWLWFCKENWSWKENLDILWNPRICFSWGHPEQGSWPFSRLLVSWNPDVWTANWHPTIYRCRPNEDLQHNSQGWTALLSSWINILPVT